MMTRCFGTSAIFNAPTAAAYTRLLVGLFCGIRWSSWCTNSSRYLISYIFESGRKHVRSSHQSSRSSETTFFLSPVVMAQHAKTKETTYDSQRRRIEKLMENPDALVELPDSTMSAHKRYEPPDFVRNVMGSSAGAGSGEFHVYRHLRRKEMTRLKEMEESAKAEELDAEYKSQLESLKRKAEEVRLKKKMKRDKKKSKMRERRNEKAQSGN